LVEKGIIFRKAVILFSRFKIVRCGSLFDSIRFYNDELACAYNYASTV